MAIINSNYPAKSVSYGSTRKADAIKYIVIHYTGNTTDKALNNAKYFMNTNGRTAGAHYFVDAGDIVYQSISPLKVAWAVGGTKLSNCSSTGGGTMHNKITNANSISIELCSTNGAFASDTLKNAKELVKQLMEKYNIPASNVYRHFDVTGKLCPGWKGWHSADNSKWKAFKEGLADAPKPAEKPESVKYYPKYTGKSESIVVALGASGEKNTSLNNRKKIAAANGIKGYTGTATQNMTLLALIKKGKLKKA